MVKSVPYVQVEISFCFVLFLLFFLTFIGFLYTVLFFPLYFSPFSVSSEWNGTFRKTSSSFTTDTQNNSKAVHTLVNKSICKFLPEFTFSLHSFHFTFHLTMMRASYTVVLQKKWKVKSWVIRIYNDQQMKCTQAQLVHLDPPAANLVKIQLNNLTESLYVTFFKYKGFQ